MMILACVLYSAIACFAQIVAPPPVVTDSKPDVVQPVETSAWLGFPDWWNGAVSWAPPPNVFVHKIKPPSLDRPKLRVCFARYKIAGMYPQYMYIYAAMTPGGFTSPNGHMKWRARCDQHLTIIYTSRVSGFQYVAFETELPGLLEWVGDDVRYVYMATQVEPPWEFYAMVWRGSVAPNDWFTYVVPIYEFGGDPAGPASPRDWPPKLVMFTNGGHAR